MPAPTKPNTFSNTPPATNVIDADQVNANFDTLYSALANGAISADQLASADKLGLSGASTVRRGTFNVPGAESRTNTAYGFLASPDRVQNVVLPNNGVIVVAYQATWQASGSSTGNAAIFIGSNQVQFAQPDTTTGPAVQAATTTVTSGRDAPLATFPGGLWGSTSATAGAYTGDVTTGQIIGQNIGGSSPPNAFGGLCHIFAAAGTYDVGVQFKATSGSVTVKGRKLWVWTIGF